MFPNSTSEESMAVLLDGGKRLLHWLNSRPWFQTTNKLFDILTFADLEFTTHAVVYDLILPSPRISDLNLILQPEKNGQILPATQYLPLLVGWLRSYSTCAGRLHFELLNTLQSIGLSNLPSKHSVLMAGNKSPWLNCHVMGDDETVTMSMLNSLVLVTQWQMYRNNDCTVELYITASSLVLLTSFQHHQLLPESEYPFLLDHCYNSITPLPLAEIPSISKMSVIDVAAWVAVQSAYNHNLLSSVKLSRQNTSVLGVALVGRVVAVSAVYTLASSTINYCDTGAMGAHVINKRCSCAAAVVQGSDYFFMRLHDIDAALSGLAVLDSSSVFILCQGDSLIAYHRLITIGSDIMITGLKSRTMTPQGYTVLSPFNSTSSSSDSTSSSSTSRLRVKPTASVATHIFSRHSTNWQGLGLLSEQRRFSAAETPSFSSSQTIISSTPLVLFPMTPPSSGTAAGPSFMTPSLSDLTHTLVNYRGVITRQWGFCDNNARGGDVDGCRSLCFELDDLYLLRVNEWQWTHGLHVGVTITLHHVHRILHCKHRKRKFDHETSSETSNTLIGFDMCAFSHLALYSVTTPLCSNVPETRLLSTAPQTVLSANPTDRIWTSTTLLNTLIVALPFNALPQLLHSLSLLRAKFSLTLGDGLLSLCPIPIVSLPSASSSITMRGPLISLMCDSQNSDKNHASPCIFPSEKSSTFTCLRMSTQSRVVRAVDVFFKHSEHCLCGLEQNQDPGIVEWCMPLDILGKVWSSVHGHPTGKLVPDLATSSQTSQSQCTNTLRSSGWNSNMPNLLVGFLMLPHPPVGHATMLLCDDTEKIPCRCLDLFNPRWLGRLVLLHRFELQSCARPNSNGNSFMLTFYSSDLEYWPSTGVLAEESRTDQMSFDDPVGCYYCLSREQRIIQYYIVLAETVLRLRSLLTKQMRSRIGSKAATATTTLAVSSNAESLLKDHQPITYRLDPSHPHNVCVVPLAIYAPMLPADGVGQFTCQALIFTRTSTDSNTGPRSLSFVPFVARLCTILCSYRCAPLCQLLHPGVMYCLPPNTAYLIVWQSDRSVREGVTVPVEALPSLQWSRFLQAGSGGCASVVLQWSMFSAFELVEPTDSHFEPEMQWYASWLRSSDASRLWSQLVPTPLASVMRWITRPVTLLSAKSYMDCVCESLAFAEDAVVTVRACVVSVVLHRSVTSGHVNRKASIEIQLEDPQYLSHSSPDGPLVSSKYPSPRMALMMYEEEWLDANTNFDGQGNIESQTLCSIAACWRFGLGSWLQAGQWLEVHRARVRFSRNLQPQLLASAETFLNPLHISNKSPYFVPSCLVYGSTSLTNIVQAAVAARISVITGSDTTGLVLEPPYDTVTYLHTQLYSCKHAAADLHFYAFRVRLLEVTSAHLALRCGSCDATFYMPSIPRLRNINGQYDMLPPTLLRTDRNSNVFDLRCAGCGVHLSNIGRAENNSVRLYLEPPDLLDSFDNDLPLGLSRLKADARANGSAPLILECDVTMRVDDGTANAFFTFRNRLMMRLLRWSASEWSGLLALILTAQDCTLSYSTAVIRHLDAGSAKQSESGNHLFSKSPVPGWLHEPLIRARRVHDSTGLAVRAQQVHTQATAVTFLPRLRHQFVLASTVSRTTLQTQDSLDEDNGQAVQQCVAGVAGVASFMHTSCTRLYRVVQLLPEHGPAMAAAQLLVQLGDSLKHAS